jgi:hypothetical protein
VNVFVLMVVVVDLVVVMSIVVVRLRNHCGRGDIVLLDGGGRDSGGTGRVVTGGVVSSVLGGSGVVSSVFGRSGVVSGVLVSSGVVASVLVTSVFVSNGVITSVFVSGGVVSGVFVSRVLLTSGVVTSVAVGSGIVTSRVVSDRVGELEFARDCPVARVRNVILVPGLHWCIARSGSASGCAGRQSRLASRCGQLDLVDGNNASCLVDIARQTAHRIARKTAHTAHQITLALGTVRWAWVGWVTGEACREMSIDQSRDRSKVVFLVCCAGQVCDMRIEGRDDLAGGREENECDVHDLLFFRKNDWGEKGKNVRRWST